MIDTHKACVSCQSDKINAYPVIHHFLCAYIGPLYDFLKTPQGYQCPKCQRFLQKDEGSDWQNVGQVKQCQSCGDEQSIDKTIPSNTNILDC
jgi:hypothetical protein